MKREFNLSLWARSELQLSTNEAATLENCMNPSFFLLVPYQIQSDTIICRKKTTHFCELSYDFMSWR